MVYVYFACVEAGSGYREEISARVKFLRGVHHHFAGPDRRSAGGFAVRPKIGVLLHHRGSFVFPSWSLISKSTLHILRVVSQSSPGDKSGGKLENSPGCAGETVRSAVASETRTFLSSFVLLFFRHSPRAVCLPCRSTCYPYHPPGARESQPERQGRVPRVSTRLGAALASYFPHLLRTG